MERAAERRYCIIGAGFCGLGVAKALRDFGIPFDCYERNADVGGNWLNGVYDSAHIISSRDTTQFADFPMPRDYPDFPSGAQVLAYLRAFADRFGLRERIRFSTEVVEAAPLEPTGMKGWRVRLAGGEERVYAGVIVANGHHWDKRVPAYPGEFTGKAFHSKDYKSPADFEGGRVLVVGAGNSGCDVAVEAALSGRDSLISMRRGYYFLPKTLFGIPTAEFDRPWLPFAAQKAVIKTALRLTVGPNSRYGLEEPDHEIFDHHPIVNSQLLYFIRHGRVTPKPDIERFEGKRVRFKDGSEAEVDTVVWATGFDVSFPFLDSRHFEWENGIPKRVAAIFAPDLAGLYVFGLAQPRGGAGPLITASARFLAEAIQLQELLDHPIARDLARLAPASARMLVGVSQSQREIRLGRLYLRWLRRSVGKGARSPGSGSRPRPRNVRFPFGPEIPRHWFLDSALATHIANSLNLLFPEGERFFIRSIKPFNDRITDPELKARVQAFMSQEIRHGREHERFFEVLRAQGFELEPFMRWYDRIAYRWIERAVTPKMRLAVTAAVEHYTAAFAEEVLSDGLMRDHAHPALSALFRWHASEEIEHKSVAFDVLQRVAPGYFLRVGGLLIATTTLGGFWLAGTLTLLRQDDEASLARVLREILKGLRRGTLVRGSMARAFVQYLMPGFHPSQIPNHGLALDALRELEGMYEMTQT